MTKHEYNLWTERPNDFIDGEIRPGSRTDYEVRERAEQQRERTYAEINESIRRAKGGSCGD